MQDGLSTVLLYLVKVWFGLQDGEIQGLWCYGGLGPGRPHRRFWEGGQSRGPGRRAGTCQCKVWPGPLEPGAEASGSGQDRAGYQERETDLGLYCTGLLGNEEDGRLALGICGS